MTRLLGMLALLGAWALATAASAHEIRPGYLSLQETDATVFQVLWKVPALGDQRLGLYARLPKTCTSASEPARRIDDGAYTERWTTRCHGGLTGQRLEIDGLRATLTDVLVRIEYIDGSSEVTRLTPENAGFNVAGAQSATQVAWTYLVMGAEHILLGFDHLAFVLALILLIRDRWMLVKSITAFTVAHSLTLAGVTLGYLSLPQKPVEATIALSIAFVARELALARPGERRTSERFPWVIAFAFGLLHGFGFAGALRETGLPQTDVPLALLAFNLGVEAGQLLFVGFVLLSIHAFRAVSDVPSSVSRRVAAYAIGTVSMVWLVSRLAGFAGMSG